QRSANRPVRTTDCKVVLHSEDVTTSAYTFQLRGYGWLQGSYGLMEDTIQTASISGFQRSAIRLDRTTDCKVVLHSEDVTTGAYTFQLRGYGWLQGSYGLMEDTIQTASISGFQRSAIRLDRTADCEAVLHSGDVTTGA